MPPSLRKQTSQNFKVIVVDDGSTDGTSEMIQKEYSEVMLLHGDANPWWTGATNLEFEYTLSRVGQNDYILTFSNYTVVRSDYIQTLLNSASKHQRCLIGSISVSNEDESTVVDAGVRINWLTAKYANLAKGRGYKDVCVICV